MSTLGNNFILKTPAAETWSEKTIRMHTTKTFLPVFRKQMKMYRTMRNQFVLKMKMYRTMRNPSGQFLEYNFLNPRNAVPSYAAAPMFALLAPGGQDPNLPGPEEIPGPMLARAVLLISLGRWFLIWLAWIQAQALLFGFGFGFDQLFEVLAYLPPADDEDEDDYLDYGGEDGQGTELEAQPEMNEGQEVDVNDEHDDRNDGQDQHPFDVLPNLGKEGDVGEHQEGAQELDELEERDNEQDDHLDDDVLGNRGEYGKVNEQQQEGADLEKKEGQEVDVNDEHDDRNDGQDEHPVDVLANLGEDGKVHEQQQEGADNLEAQNDPEMKEGQEDDLNDEQEDRNDDQDEHSVDVLANMGKEGEVGERQEGAQGLDELEERDNEQDEHPDDDVLGNRGEDGEGAELEAQYDPEMNQNQGQEVDVNDRNDDQDEHPVDVLANLGKESEVGEHQEGAEERDDEQDEHPDDDVLGNLEGLVEDQYEMDPLVEAPVPPSQPPSSCVSSGGMDVPENNIPSSGRTPVEEVQNRIVMRWPWSVWNKPPEKFTIRYFCPLQQQKTDTERQRIDEGHVQLLLEDEKFKEEMNDLWPSLDNTDGAAFWCDMFNTHGSLSPLSAVEYFSSGLQAAKYLDEGGGVTKLRSLCGRLCTEEEVASAFVFRADIVGELKEGLLVIKEFVVPLNAELRSYPGVGQFVVEVPDGKTVCLPCG